MSDEAAATPDKAAKGPKAPTLTRKTLVERVLAATPGAKPKEAKAIIEATLAVMGAAVKAGENLQLPPFGRARTKAPADAASAAKGVRMTVKQPPAKVKEPKVKPPKPAKADKPAKAKAPRAPGQGKARQAKEGG